MCGTSFEPIKDGALWAVPCFTESYIESDKSTTISLLPIGLFGLTSTEFFLDLYFSLSKIVGFISTPILEFSSLNV